MKKRAVTAACLLAVTIGMSSVNAQASITQEQQIAAQAQAAAEAEAQAQAQAQAEALAQAQAAEAARLQAEAEAKAQAEAQAQAQAQAELAAKQAALEAQAKAEAEAAQAAARNTAEALIAQAQVVVPRLSADGKTPDEIDELANYYDALYTPQLQTETDPVKIAEANQKLAEAAEMHRVASLLRMGTPIDASPQTVELARKFVADVVNLCRNMKPAKFQVFDNQFVSMNGILFPMFETGEGFTTSFKTSGANRCSNLQQASNSLNSVVIFPGQTFSYDKCLGPRNAANGYKIAGIFLNGQHAEGMGGGICQGSTTLYNAVIKTPGLTVVERHTHSLPVAYVKKGMDATVSEGTLDFRFRNDNPYPVVLTSYIQNKTITCNFFGVMVP